MIINLPCTKKYLVNVFFIKYHHIYNILYGCKGLLGLSRVNRYLTMALTTTPTTLIKLELHNFIIGN